MTPPLAVPQSFPPAPSAPSDRRLIAHATSRGVLYAGLGQAFTFAFSLAGGILLARLLTPAHFGLYALVSFLVVKLNALVEVGLSAPLIHQRQEPSLREQRTTFTFHCIASALIYALVFSLAPALALLFQLTDDGITLSRVTAFLLLLHPLRTIPVALLSRRLNYVALSAAEIVDASVYQITAVIFATLGHAAWSFAYAALLSTVSGIFLLYLLSPWRLGFAWDAAALLRSLRFGTAFQLSSLTAVIRDNVITLIGGPLFGPNAVGLLNWALRLPWVCTQAFVAVSVRVGFPSLSRIRDDSSAFNTAITKMLRYVNLTTFLCLSVVTALTPDIVHLVYTDKWIPAIPFVYLFAVRMVAGNYTTFLDLSLKAQGYPERSLKVLSLWTLGEAVLTLVLAVILGPMGIALAAALGIWFAIAMLRREFSSLLPLSFRDATVVPCLSAGITFLALCLIRKLAITTLPHLAATIVGGMLLFILVARALAGRTLWNEFRSDLARALRSVTLSPRQSARPTQMVHPHPEPSQE